MRIFMMENPYAILSDPGVNVGLASVKLTIALPLTDCGSDFTRVITVRVRSMTER